jgi:Sec-independent protein translocase protein TatA
MFDISWGEMFIVGVVGVSLVGRKDMPAVCHTVGYQLGRVVGLLQGFRQRADQFTSHHSLSKIQNELRSNLRELDQVKLELAIASSPTHSIVGRTLGPITNSANYNNNNNNIPSGGGVATTNNSNTSYIQPSLSSISSSTQQQQQQQQQESIGVPPRERAVIEEEWYKQGIGFKSRAETDRNNRSGLKSASEILENLQRQILIFDQYDVAMSNQSTAEQERRRRRRQEEQIMLSKQQQQVKHEQKKGETTISYDVVYDDDDDNTTTTNQKK